MLIIVGAELTALTLPPAELAAARICGCVARTPYRLNAYLLDAPYWCGNCGGLYSSWGPFPVEKIPLNKKASIGITWLRRSHNPCFLVKINSHKAIFASKFADKFAFQAACADKFSFQIH